MSVAYYTHPDELTHGVSGESPYTHCHVHPPGEPEEEVPGVWRGGDGMTGGIRETLVGAADEALG